MAQDIDSRIVELRSDEGALESGIPLVYGTGDASMVLVVKDGHVYLGRSDKGGIAEAPPRAVWNRKRVP